MSFGMWFSTSYVLLLLRDGGKEGGFRYVIWNFRFLFI
jgi:hypothetical protein